MMASPRSGLDALAQKVWAAYGADTVTEAEASDLCELIAARRVVPVNARPEGIPHRVGSRPRSSSSVARRRGWSASGWLPPRLAGAFTLGEQAALGVIMSTIAMSGSCDLCHGAVAGRAGVSISTVKRALVEARRLGLITVTERRLSWCRNLPNIVMLLSAELKTWVATRGRGLRAAKAKGGGVQIGTGPKSISIALRGKGSRQDPFRKKSIRRVGPTAAQPERASMWS